MKLGICSNCNSSVWKSCNRHHWNFGLALFWLSTGKLKRSFLPSQALHFSSSSNLKPHVWEDTRAQWSFDQIHHGVRILLNHATGLVTWKRKTKQQTVFLAIANFPKRRYIVTSILRKDTCSLTRQAILQEIHPMTLMTHLLNTDIFQMCVNPDDPRPALNFLVHS